jgi:quercetin dioxygenase-like cupin family protein
MHILEQQRPEPTAIPGVAHATWACAAQGLSQLSLWRQTLAPGAATPPHSHDCDEVVLCLSGQGELHCDGALQRFGAESTLILPKGREHQLVNAGSQALEIIGIFAATPVGTFLADGQAIALPWRS